MKSRAFALMTGALICVFSAPMWAQSGSQWVDIKNANELRDLYSNKTFRGNGWVGHYRADGKGILIRAGREPEPRTWEVKGNDWVCGAASNQPPACYRFQRNRTNPNEVLATSVNTGRSYIFKVEDGIPEF